MASRKRVLSGIEETDMEGMKGKYSGFRLVSRKAGTRKRKGRLVLKKGCKWGRGRYKGKVFCRIKGRKAA